MRKVTEKARELLKKGNKITPTNRNCKKERNQNIRELQLQGMSLAEIGTLYNISKQRVSQILYEMGVSAHEEIGKKTDKKVIQELRQAVENWKARAKHNRELYAKERLKVHNLHLILANRDKKIAKLSEKIAKNTLHVK